MSQLTLSGSLLEGLNPEQQEVVLHDQGPCLVVACAGAGKTRALVHRMGYLITELDVNPARILAVTFTRKAAEEMKLRLRSLIGETSASISTVHSLAWKILMEDCGVTSNNFDRGQHGTLVKRACEKARLDPNIVNRMIGLSKADLAPPKSPRALEIAKKLYEEWRKKRRGAGAFKAPLPALLVDAYSITEEARKAANIFTQDDAIYYAVAAFYRSEDVMRKWQSRFDYVIQDEGQDESLSQHKLMEMLSGGHRNYMIIGDPSQVLYSFRGAHPDKLMSFRNDWPDAKLIQMNRNYRSGLSIIEIANNVLRAMPEESKLGKEICAESKHDAKVYIEAHSDQEEQGRAIAHHVQTLFKDGTKLEDIAVLYRVRSLERAIEEALIREKIPYVVIGGGSFFDRSEIRDLLAYISVAIGRGTESDVRHCLNSPKRFLGREFVGHVMRASKRQRGPIDWLGCVQEASNQSKIWAKQIAAADDWATIIHCIRDNEANTNHAGEVMQWLVSHTGYEDFLLDSRGDPSIENDCVNIVREFIGACSKFRTLSDLMDHVELMRGLEKDSRRNSEKQQHGKVQLMTIHGSKGLEFPTVIFAGVNQDIIPHHMSDPKDEELRLFYVATTRAKERLIYMWFSRTAGSEHEYDASEYLRAFVVKEPPVEVYNELGRGLEEPVKCLEGSDQASGRIRSLEANVTKSN